MLDIGREAAPLFRQVFARTSTGMAEGERAAQARCT